MINIGLIGVGLIGKQVLIDIKKIQGVNIIGLCNSKKYIIGNNIGLTEWDRVENSKDQDILNVFIDKLKIFEKLVIIDCTASLTIAKKYIEWMKNGIYIVTPNKKAFSSEISLWYNIKELNNKLCYYESTVCAGLPIISTIEDMKTTGDDFYRIEGVFSGTLSFIFNEFCMKNENFSDIIKKSSNLGYMEPDPRDNHKIVLIQCHSDNHYQFLIKI